MRISDWSSDVCSSDLQVAVVHPGIVDVLARLHLGLQLFDDVAFLDQVVLEVDPGDLGERAGERGGFVFMGGDRLRNHIDVHAAERQSGRASCRESVCQYVEISLVDVSLKKNNK